MNVISAAGSTFLILCWKYGGGDKRTVCLSNKFMRKGEAVGKLRYLWGHPVSSLRHLKLMRFAYSSSTLGCLPTCINNIPTKGDAIRSQQAIFYTEKLWGSGCF